MRNENKPDQAANNKDHRSSNEYLLQYFHISLLDQINVYVTPTDFQNSVMATMVSIFYHGITWPS